MVSTIMLEELDEVQEQVYTYKELEMVERVSAFLGSIHTERSNDCFFWGCYELSPHDTGALVIYDTKKNGLYVSDDLDDLLDNKYAGYILAGMARVHGMEFDTNYEWYNNNA